MVGAHRSHALLVVGRGAVGRGLRRLLRGRGRGTELRGRLFLRLCHLRPGRRLRGGAAHGGFDVAFDDAAAGAAARQLLEIDAGLGGHARGNRRDDEATALRALAVAARFGRRGLLLLRRVLLLASLGCAGLRVGGRAARIGLDRLLLDLLLDLLLGLLLLLGLCRAGRGFGRRPEMSSSGSPMMAMMAPSGTVSPSWTIILRSTPVASACVSIVALSVSISASGSPIAHLVALFLQPARELPLLHRRRQLRHHDLRCHRNPQ